MVTSIRKIAKITGKLLILGIALIFSGCFDIKGLHYVNHKGDSDSGGYVISMNSAVYTALILDKPWIFDDLFKFSRPSTTTRDGNTYISDTTGKASMEHFYKKYECNPVQNKKDWSDCSFYMGEDGWNFPSWSIEWEVTLHEEMIIISSNHHRQRVSEGKKTLIWYFDGNRVSAFNVSFTVRVPNAERQIEGKN